MRSISLFLLLQIGALSAAAGTTAYVPVCCNSNSTVSVFSTTANRVTASLTAGAGSYGVTFVHSTAWVTNPSDRTISVLSLPSGRLLKTISVKLDPWLIQVSPDATRVYVVTGMFAGSLNHYAAALQVLDAQTGAPIGSVPLPNDGLQNPGLAIAPDGSRVYATFDSQTVVVYDAASGKTAATWTTTRPLTWIATGTLTLSPDGSTLYTAGQVLTAIDTATGDVKGTVNPPGFAGLYSFVGSALTPDGATLYASYSAQVGTGSGIAAIDTASLTLTASAALGGELLQPFLSRDNSTLYVPDHIDSLLYIVDAATLMASSSVALEGLVYTAAFDTSTTLYIPNSSTASTIAMNTATLAPVSKIPVSGTSNPQVGLTGPTNASAPANGSYIFVAGIESNSISAINPLTHKVISTYTAGDQSPSVTGVNPPFIMATPNGRQIYLAGSDFQSMLTEIDTVTGAVNGIPCNIGLGCQVTSITALPDSSRVYLAGFASGLLNNPPFFYVVDTAGLTVVASLRFGFVGPMAAAPSGAFLYIATGPTISIFDTTQNTVTGILPVAGVTAIAFSPDGSLAYAAAGAILNVIATASRTVVSTLSLGSGNFTVLAVSPDGDQIWATAQNSTSVTVVNTHDFSTQTVEMGLPVSGVAFGVN